MRIHKAVGPGVALLLMLACSKNVTDDTHTVQTAQLTPVAQLNMHDLAERPARTKSPLYHDVQRMPGPVNGYGDLISVVRNPAAVPTFTAYQTAPQLLAWVVVRASGGGLGYPPYGVGKSCVYVQKSAAWPNPTELRHLETVIMWHHDINRSCPGRPGPPFYKIEVAGKHSVSGTTHPNAEIPDAVRLDFDRNSTPIIGVKCVADFWCELGDSPGTSPPGGSTKKNVKGWYDQQYLSEFTVAGLKRTTTFAAIYPAENLETYDSTDDFDAAFVRVATIKITRKPGGGPADGSALQYYAANKWLLPTVPSVGDEIELWIQHRPTGWWAEYRLNGVAGFEIQVKYTDDPPGVPTVPGTARWGWSETDEMAWVRCGAGCCEVGSEEFLRTALANMQKARQ